MTIEQHNLCVYNYFLEDNFDSHVASFLLNSLNVLPKFANPDADDLLQTLVCGFACHPGREEKTLFEKCQRNFLPQP